MSSKNQRLENKKNSNLRLISSTIKNLSKKGINDLTMNDISQGAGLSQGIVCLLYTSPSPRDKRQSRMPSSA